MDHSICPLRILRDMGNRTDRVLPSDTGEKTGLARSSCAPWVRSDFTGFEIASGEMATFTLPESVADMARAFWKADPVKENLKSLTKYE